MIRPVGVLDTWALASTLYGKRQELADAGEGLSVLSIPPRATKEWRSLSATLTRIRTAATAILKYSPEFEQVAFFRLAPHSFTPWSKSAEGRLGLHLTLLGSPHAAHYVAGGPPVTFAQGVVNLVDHRQLNSWVNNGDTPVIELVLELNGPPDLSLDTEG